MIWVDSQRQARLVLFKRRHILYPAIYSIFAETSERLFSHLGQLRRDPPYGASYIVWNIDNGDLSIGVTVPRTDRNDQHNL